MVTILIASLIVQALFCIWFAKHNYDEGHSMGYKTGYMLGYDDVRKVNQTELNKAYQKGKMEAAESIRSQVIDWLESGITTLGGRQLEGHSEQGVDLYDHDRRLHEDV